MNCKQLVFIITLQIKSLMRREMGWIVICILILVGATARGFITVSLGFGFVDKPNHISVEECFQACRATSACIQWQWQEHLGEDMSSVWRSE